MQENQNNCFGSKKRNMTLRQAKRARVSQYNSNVHCCYITGLVLTCWDFFAFDCFFFFIYNVIITYNQIYLYNRRQQEAWSLFLLEGIPDAEHALLPVFNQCDRWTGQIDS